METVSRNLTEEKLLYDYLIKASKETQRAHDSLNLLMTLIDTILSLEEFRFLTPESKSSFLKKVAEPFLKVFIDSILKARKIIVEKIKELEEDDDIRNTMDKCLRNIETIVTYVVRYGEQNETRINS